MCPEHIFTLFRLLKAIQENYDTACINRTINSCGANESAAEDRALEISSKLIENITELTVRTSQELALNPINVQMAQGDSPGK